MKGYVILIAGIVVFMASCGDSNTKDQQTPGTSGSKIDPPASEASGSSDQSAAPGHLGDSADVNNSMQGTDSASVRFLLNAADGGMAEVETGKLAQGNAKHESVKRFAQMMVNDHSGANEQVKKLSTQRRIDLSKQLSSEHKSALQALSQRKASNFDESYMAMMVKDHQKTIELFERSAKEIKDKEVTSFIVATLPKLHMHLDSALSIQRRVKKGE